MQTDRLYFHDEDAALAHFEQLRWKERPQCPRCGEHDRIGKIKANPKRKIRKGLYQCKACRKQFTAKMGTVFEHSHLPMRTILTAIYDLASSKKGISSCQLKQKLEVSYKTAWFLSHRIREAMREKDLTPLGMQGHIVEADETFYSQKKGQPKAPKGKRSIADKQPILSLVDRHTKQKRSIVIKKLTTEEIGEVLRDNLSADAELITDRASHYQGLRKYFARHHMVKHSAEFVSRENPQWHINCVEASFSCFKLGMTGVYQHCDAKHLDRYVAEFEFRYNHRGNALGLVDLICQNSIGKRLSYREVKAA